MRYVESGEMADVSDAVHRLCRADIAPRLDSHLFTMPNIFRMKYAYTEAVDDALRLHEASLRLIYERASKLNGQSVAKGIANKLVDSDSWNQFCYVFELIDVDLAERDATLAFVWSRMRVKDEQSELGRIKLTHLAFEDFLEALCRVSVCKAWPYPEEIEAAGAGNAGAYMLQLKGEEPDKHAEILATRAVPWGHRPLQPIARCVEMMCELLVVTCKQRVGGGTSNGVAGAKLSLSEKDVAAFMKLPKIA